MRSGIGGRVSLLVVLSLAALGVFASSALAGVPKFGAITSYGFTPNSETFSSSVNPEGAATTVYFEIKKSGGSYETFATTSIGSGKVAVPVSANMIGLVPNYYEVRISASNSGGTAYSGVKKVHRAWYIEKEKEGTGSTFSSYGTWRLDYKVEGNAMKIECTESGFGSLGHTDGSGDYYNVSLTGCGYYANGALVCKLSPMSYGLNAAFSGTGGFTGFGGMYVRLCSGSEETPIAFNAPFKVTMPAEYGLSHPATLTVPANILGNSGTITSATTWTLSGANVGKKFEWEG